MVDFVGKLFSQLRYPKIVHWVPKHKFCLVWRAKGWLNALKHTQISFGVYWGRMVDFIAKPFSQLRHPKILHSGSKHKFCLIWLAEGLGNAPKHSQTSFGVYWGRIVYFIAKPFSQLRYHEIVHSGPKHKFCLIWRAEGLGKAPKHTQISFGV